MKIRNLPFPSWGKTRKGGLFMKKTTKLIAILMAIMTLVNLTPAIAKAATNPPYCRISYDSSLGCNTVKYYAYDKSGVARYDASRLIKFYDRKILLGTSNTVVTSKHKAGTNPAWILDGSYLVWQETDESFHAHKYATGENIKLADKILAIGINSDSMAETVTLADGKSVKISTLISESTSTPQKPTQTPSTPSSVPKTNKKIKEWTDSLGREHFKFGKNELIVDGKNIFFNNFKISELCNSGVKFIGIDSSYYVYLYEDASDSYYQFSPKNIFVPKKISFPKKGKLLSVINDSNGFLKKIVTTSGTFSIKELTKPATWKPPISYAINKANYCTYYIAKTTKSYTLKRKGSSLYLGKKLIARGISKGSNAFGFKGKNLYYAKNGKIQEAKISNPKKAHVVKGAKKITFSKKNGQVILKK